MLADLYLSRVKSSNLLSEFDGEVLIKQLESEMSSSVRYQVFRLRTAAVMVAIFVWPTVLNFSRLLKWFRSLVAADSSEEALN